MLTFLLKYKLRAAGLVLLIALGAYILALRSQLTAAVIAKNNAEAAADTLKVKYRDDSVVVVGILAFQSDQLKTLRDSLNLKGKAKTNTQLTVRPEPRRETHGDSPESPPDIVLADSLVGPPADVKVAVGVWAQADSSLYSQWEWQLDPTPIPLTIDVGCLERLKPDVLVGSPPWAQIEDVTTNVDSDVCGSQKTSHGVGYYAVRIAGAGLLFLGGAAAF